jgi:hypothetical protein
MPNITMLDIDHLKQTSLKPLIERCLELRAPDPAFFAMMGHNPSLAERMYLAWGASFNDGVIPHRLKEVIRVQLSRMVACTY